ncbi:Agamous-like MADS-box protein AGL8 homolog [Linum perenne]
MAVLQNQVMCESILELQKKDKALREQNNQLAKKVKEREKDIVSQEAQLGQQQASTIAAQPFQHLDSSESFIMKLKPIGVRVCVLQVSYMELMRRLGIR